MSSWKAFWKLCFHSINSANFSTNCIHGQNICRNIKRKFKLKRLLYRKGDPSLSEAWCSFSKMNLGWIFWGLTHTIVSAPVSSVSKQIINTPIRLWFFSSLSTIQPPPESCQSLNDLVHMFASLRGSCPVSSKNDISLFKLIACSSDDKVPECM